MNAGKSNRNLVWLLGATVTVLSLAGCELKPEDVCEGGTTTCTSGTPYGCYNKWGVHIAYCAINIGDANSWCYQNGGGSWTVHELDCNEYAGEAGETGEAADWDPGQYVSNPSSGYYYVDSDLVDEIKSDFTILELDSTVFVDSGLNDYFQLSGVASGDLADVLGLQSGDILLSVNGQSLDGIEDAIDAYDTVENATTLALTFKRSGTNYTYIYIIL